MEALSVALFLSVANKSIVDCLAKPLKKRFKGVDFWFLVYVALASGVAIGWLSEANVFGQFIPSVVTGRVLTAILVGGGSSLIHDVFGSE